MAINLGIVFYIYLAMYLTWSVVGSDLIYGTQGRYYLPLLPFIVIFLAKFWSLIRNRWPVRLMLLGLAMMLVLISIVEGLRIKYFDYSKNYTNFNFIEMAIKNIKKSDKVDRVATDKNMNFLVEVANSNVSGFKVNLDNREMPILIPYRYRVMDSECKKTYRSGYLKQYDIQNDTVYAVKFDPFTVEDSRLCFELEPFTFGLNGYTQSFLSIKTVNQRLLFEWLYFSKE